MLSHTRAAVLSRGVSAGGGKLSINLVLQREKADTWSCRWFKGITASQMGKPHSPHSSSQLLQLLSVYENCLNVSCPFCTRDMTCQATWVM